MDDQHHDRGETESVEPRGEVSQRGIARAWRRSVARMEEPQARAWAELYAHCRRVAAHVVRQWTDGADHDRGTELVDEVVQDLFCRLLERDGRLLRRATVESDRRLASYVARICRSILIDRRRQESAVKRGGDRVIVGLDDASATEERRTVPPAASPERRAVRTDLARRTAALVCESARRCAQPERDLWIFRRFVLDGWSVREISGSVGLGGPGVSAVVLRLRRRARDLARRGELVPRIGSGAERVSA